VKCGYTFESEHLLKRCIERLVPYETAEPVEFIFMLLQTSLRNLTCRHERFSPSVSQLNEIFGSFNPNRQDTLVCRAFRQLCYKCVILRCCVVYPYSTHVGLRAWSNTVFLCSGDADSNIGPDVYHHGWYSLWLYSVTPREYLDGAIKTCSFISSFKFIIAVIHL
jgi:hypothetical protein